MADQYDALAASMGLTPAQTQAWKRQLGVAPIVMPAPPPDRNFVDMGVMPPAAPPPARSPGPPPPAPPGHPSYDGAKLQDYMPQAPPPIGPPSPPRPSYEGAALTAPTTPGFAPANPIVRPTGPTMRMQTADNLQPAAAPMSPKVAAQVERVATNSEKTQDRVKEAVDADERKKNLAGATFYGGGEGGGAAPLDASLAGAPKMVDPGGRKPSAWQVQEGLDLGPQAERAVESADEHGRAAAGLDFMAGQKAAEFERGYLERSNDAAERYALEQNARAERFQRDYDTHIGKLDELLGQIREAKQDPFGGLNSGAARIGQAIAIGLGAFASKSGENLALEAIKHQTNMAIRTQEEQLAGFDRGARGEMNFLSALRQQYGDVDQAKAAARVAYLEYAKTELARQLGSPETADPRMLAAYERIQGALDKDYVEAQAKFRSLTKDRVVRHDVNAPPQYAVGAAGAALSKHDEENVGHMTEALVKSGVPQMREDVTRLLAQIPKEGDIPGVGGVSNFVPDKFYNWVGSTRGHEIRQAAAVLFNQQLKDQAGAAVSDQELERQKQAFYGARDAESARRTLIAYANRLNELEATIRSRANPEVNEVQRARQRIERGKLDRKSGFTGPETE